MNETKRSLGSIIFTSSLGTLIEWYDIYIFGMLPRIISTHFFPKGNQTAALLSTLFIAAAGFLVRPFGALVFGRLGGWFDGNIHICSHRNEYDDG